MASIAYERNKKYFKPVSYKGAIVLGIVGLLLLFTGDSGPVVFGLLLLAAAGGLLFRQLGGRPSDEEIEAQSNELMHGLRQQALAKLGLDEDQVKLIDPIVVGGPYFGSLGANYSVKRGKDGIFRSSNVEGVVMYFGEHQLHSYKYQASLTTANERSESTDEYFYRDVVSVSTQSTSQRVSIVGGSAETVNFEVFKLTTSGGTSIQSAMSDTGDRTSKSIQGARQLIRDRKMIA